jgi:hypothetical protein
MAENQPMPSHIIADKLGDMSILLVGFIFVIIPMKQPKVLYELKSPTTLYLPKNRLEGNHSSNSLLVHVSFVLKTAQGACLTSLANKGSPAMPRADDYGINS